ncbi:YdaU family protein [Thauera aromatica]|uniref:YdaU family protein n=1 Tax=Thauera aromatica TaxID=59405 RepID=UPI001FFDB962|nr:YdaU family protein [Thauera aromatica]MCK2097118.1 YdaU family protein [Thauera aromatica]
MTRPTRRSSANPPRPFRFSVQLPALIAETQHLDPEAFGCLMRLMLAYWQSGPAKDDDRVLARLVGLSSDEWASIRPDVEPFFDVLHGQWLHWRLDEELEAAYDAINKNAARTKAATAARKAKRNDERDVVRNDEHDVENLCNQRDVVRNEHPIGSIRTPHAAAGTTQAQTPRAKAKDFSSFEDDVAIAERDLGIGGKA